MKREVSAVDQVASILGNQPGRKQILILLADLEMQVSELREAHKVLHRRCQSAESGLAAKLTSGPCFGRALANAAAHMYRAQLADLREAVGDFLSRWVDEGEGGLSIAGYQSPEADRLWAALDRTSEPHYFGPRGIATRCRDLAQELRGAGLSVTAGDLEQAAESLEGSGPEGNA